MPHISRLLTCAFAVLLPASAQAHALPFGVGLSWADPASSALPVIVTNRGLVFANGTSLEMGFSLRCNEAYGANTSDRPLAYLEASGNLTVGVYNRVLHTGDRGCSLSMASGLPELPITSLVSPASAPERMYVATRSLQQSAAVFASEDHGRTFSELFKSKPDEYYETLVVSPSDPLRLYALGLHLDRANTQVIYHSSVSTDGGKTWEDNVVPGKIIPLGVHPTKPDVVFGYQPTDRLETHFDIKRSEDRGKTYKTVLANVVMPTGFAGAKDAGTLFVGVNGQGGLYLSRDDGQTFEPLLADRVQRVTCLAEHGGKLWLCANLAPNLDAIWTLKDDASDFEKVMSFDAVSAQVACSIATAESCDLPWRDFYAEVRPLDDAGVSEDAGAGADVDAGATWDAASEEENPEDEAEPEPEEPEEEADGGPSRMRSPGGSRCQFGAAEHVASPAGGLFLFVMALFGRRRARRS